MSNKQRKKELLLILRHYYDISDDASLEELEFRYKVLKKRQYEREQKSFRNNLKQSLSDINEVYQNFDFRSHLSDMKRPNPEDEIPKDECCICLESLSCKDCVIFSKCNHWIHVECEKERRKSQKEDTCPLCRSEIEIKKPHPDFEPLINMMSLFLDITNK